VIVAADALRVMRRFRMAVASQTILFISHPRKSELLLCV
jgi:hypothetical protein